MLVTITILEDKFPNKANSIRFLVYAANVSLSEAKAMVKENISWLINTDKTTDELKLFASDYELDVSIVPAKCTIRCAFCDAEADFRIETTNTPICNTCKGIYECGQASPEATFEEIVTA